MSAEVFLDTNVLVYAFDGSALQKRKRARELLASNNWVISWQVVQEFAHVALHRFAVPMQPADLVETMRLLLWPRCHILPSIALQQAALEARQLTQYRYYDCLILASALASGATTLYSEDLQHGRTFGGLSIQNPFAGVA